MHEPSERGADALAPENARGWWSTVSAACLILAAPLVLTGWFKAAFVVVALGCVAWFLNVRGQLKRADRESSGGYYDDDSGDESDDGDADGGSDGGGDGDGGSDSD